MSTFTNFCKHLQLRIGSIEFIKTYLSMLLSTEVIFEMWFTGARDVTNLLCVGSVLAKRQDKECYNAIQEKLQAPKVKKKTDLHISLLCWILSKLQHAVHRPSGSNISYIGQANATSTNSSQITWLSFLQIALSRQIWFEVTVGACSARSRSSLWLATMTKQNLDLINQKNCLN